MEGVWSHFLDVFQYELFFLFESSCITLRSNFIFEILDTDLSIVVTYFC